MKTTILYAIAALGSFGLAAGGSWYLSQKEKAEDEKSEASDTDATDGDESGSEDPVSDSGTATTQDNRPIPTAVAPDAMTAEGIYRMTQMIQERMKRLSVREARLDAHQKRLDLIVADIQSYQQATDGLLTEFRGAVDQANEKLRGLQAESAKLEELRKQDEQETTAEPEGPTRPDPSVAPNYKKLAASYTAMAPAVAARQLTTLANDGEMEKVVWICAAIEERKLAKLLEAFEDESLAVEIAKQLSRIVHPPKKPKR